MVPGTNSSGFVPESSGGGLTVGAVLRKSAGGSHSTGGGALLSIARTSSAGTTVSSAVRSSAAGALSAGDAPGDVRDGGPQQEGGAGGAGDAAWTARRKRSVMQTIVTSLQAGRRPSMECDDAQ